MWGEDLGSTLAAVAAGAGGAGLAGTVWARLDPTRHPAIPPAVTRVTIRFSIICINTFPFPSSALFVGSVCFTGGFNVKFWKQSTPFLTGLVLTRSPASGPIKAAHGRTR